MTITCSPADVVLVSTSCCGVLFSVPTLWACFLQFLDASQTPRLRSFVNDLPQHDASRRSAPPSSRPPAETGLSATKLGIEPGLHCRVLQLRAFELRIGLQPLVELGHLRRILRAHQHLREQRVWIQRDRRQQLIERRRRQLGRLGTRRGLVPRRATGYEQNHCRGDDARRHRKRPRSDEALGQERGTGERARAVPRRLAPTPACKCCRWNQMTDSAEAR